MIGSVGRVVGWLPTVGQREGKREIFSRGVIPASNGVTMHGAWRVHIPDRPEPIVCNVTEDRGVLYISDTEHRPIASGQLDNGHISVQFSGYRDGLRFEGDLACDGDSFVLVGRALDDTDNVARDHLTIRLEQVRESP